MRRAPALAGADFHAQRHGQLDRGRGGGGHDVTDHVGRRGDIAFR